MKAMTCRQLGGPCGVELRGDTADDVIKLQDCHLREAIRGGDAAHEPAYEDMNARWGHPVRGMGLHRATKKTLADLSEA